MRDHFLVLVVDQGSALLISIGLVLGIIIGFCLSNLYHTFRKEKMDVLQTKKFRSSINQNYGRYNDGR